MVRSDDFATKIHVHVQEGIPYAKLSLLLSTHGLLVTEHHRNFYICTTPYVLGVSWGHLGAVVARLWVPIVCTLETTNQEKLYVCCACDLLINRQSFYKRHSPMIALLVNISGAQFI